MARNNEASRDKTHNHPRCSPRGRLGVRGSAWVLLVALVGACSGRAAVQATQPPPAASPEPKPSCSERLRAFDPGAPVLGRRLEDPQSVETLVGHKERVRNVACLPRETDDACRARAQDQIARTESRAVSISAAITRPTAVRAAYRVDGNDTEATFASEKELADHLGQLHAAGKSVSLLWGKNVPSESAPAHAAVTVVDDAGHRVAAEELKLTLKLKIPAETAATLGELQKRAESAGLALELFTKISDGTFLVLVSCQTIAQEHR